MQELDLGWLESGEMPGLSKRAGGNLLEACLVCLESNGHNSGITLTVVERDAPKGYRLVWIGLVGEQATNSYGDPQEATEWGACGIACALIEKVSSLVITKRSRKGTGFDYWLGNAIQDDSRIPLLFQDVARLEVSGILNDERMSVIDRRVKDKTRQIERGKHSSLPAYVIVVEFGIPLAKVVRLEGPYERQRTA